MWRVVQMVALLGAAGTVPRDARAGGDGLGADEPVGGRDLSGADRARLGVGVEYLSAPIVREFNTGNAAEKEVLLSDVVLVRLGAVWSPVRPVSLDLSAPLVVGSSGTVGAGGPALGGIELGVGLRLWSSREGRSWLALRPFLGLPAGTSARWLRDHGPSGGVSLSARGSAGPVSVYGEAGPEYRDVRTDGENLQPGVGLRASAALGVTLAQRVELGVDARTRGAGGLQPVEVGGYLSWQLTPALAWRSRVGRGVVEGPGSPGLRVTTGVSWRVPRAARTDVVDSQGDDADDVASLIVLDPLGRPLAGAAVLDGTSEVGRTDARGRIALRDLRRVDVASVRLPGFVSADVPLSGRDDIGVTLAWADVPAVLDVVDQRGNAVVATVSVVGEDTSFDLPATDGSARFVLAPGEWTVTVSAQGFLSQSRTLIARPGRVLPILSRVLLASDEAGGDAEVALTVRDSAGEPVEGVEIRVDGVAFGTTGSGGVIALSGLSAGVHRIEALGERYLPVILDAVTLLDGVNAVPVELERQPGGLRLRVRSPDGPVPDAVVRLLGPARLPAWPLGENGARMFQLRPGKWSLIVTSERFGIQTTEVVVGGEGGGVAEVDVFMQEPEGGTADLTVLAVDTDGRPLSNAEVSLDGVQIGRTSSGGQITVPGLFAGERQLDVDGDLYDAVSERIFLVDGPQEHDVVLPWVPGAVRISARTPRGTVRDGMARFSGRRDVDALPLDATGLGFTQLPTGAWGLVVTSPEHGVAHRPLAVPEVAGVLTIAEVVFRPLDVGAGSLVVSARDPENNPVVGASVRLDGVLAGTTDSTGRFSATDIAEGQRTVAVSAPMLGEGVRSVTVSERETVLNVPLSWGPGAVRVVAEGPEGTVDDAVVRFIGPEPMTPLTLGATGERLTALTPGRWQGIASSPAYGLAQIEVEISDEVRGLRTVRFDFEPIARGTAELLVRVLDPQGRALVGAAVEVGDGAPRLTGEAGAVLIRDLTPGTVRVALNADVHYPRELSAVELRPGSQERVIVLTPVPGTVRASVTDADGQAVSGQLRFLGPQDVEPVPFDGGRVEVDLPPGAWRVLAAAEGFAVASANVDIPPGAAFYDLDLQLVPASVELTEDGLVIGDAVLFDIGESTLRSDADRVLEEVATYLLADPTLLEVEVQGHTDSSGGLAVNYALSTARAQTVQAALIARGVPPERLSARGYGPSKPLAANASSAGRARNRRVQFVVTVSR